MLDVPRVPLGEVVAQRGATTPDHVAIAAPGRSWTYGDLARCAAAPGGAPDARVAVDAEDRFALAIGVMVVATHQLAVPMPDDLPAATRSEVLARVAPAAVVRAEAILAGEWQPVGRGEVTLDHPAIVLMTSGSS